MKAEFELGSWRVLRWRSQKRTLPEEGLEWEQPQGEVQKPMNNIKWIYWEGRLEREWPGEKGVYVRESKAENVFLIFFCRSGWADTQQQGCQHPPTASIAWVPRSHPFYHWKGDFNNAVSRDYCVGCGNFSAVEGSSLSISSKRELAQPELDPNRMVQYLALLHWRGLWFLCY